MSLSQSSEINLTDNGRKALDAKKSAKDVDQKIQYQTFTVSASNPWDFNNTKSMYGNWFINGDTSGNYFYNGPDGFTPWVYVQSRGSADRNRFTVTVWKDVDPTQYQRTWTGDHWTPWVILPNSSNLISTINLSPDSVKISGKNIELDGHTTVAGRLDLMQANKNWINQSSNYHNPWRWDHAHIYFDNYLQLQGENCKVIYNDNTELNSQSFYSLATLTPGYLKFTTYKKKFGEDDEKFDGQISRTYMDSQRIEAPRVYADRIFSNVAPVVTSRLSIKTDITPVSYERALAAVEGTEMYDYRYTNDDTEQHYVSGIIDDVNPTPQYHMDDMLINKERTARIDANLVGYHHVIIQKLLERVATLETNNQQLLDRVTTLEGKIK